MGGVKGGAIAFVGAHWNYAEPNNAVFLECFHHKKGRRPATLQQLLSDLVGFGKRIRNNLCGLKNWRNTTATGLSYVAAELTGWRQGFD
jgi:hypothetical protein